MRIRISERRTWSGVNPGRPVSGSFKPRSRSHRTSSTSSSWLSRKSEIFSSSGSSRMPCCRNSRSAKVIWEFSSLICRQLYEAVGQNRSIPMAIFRAIRQNLHSMAVSQESLEKRIRNIKHQISELGDLRPGALSKQYNICGNPNCRCKANPPIKHGPYYQISFSRHGKSSSQFVREEDLKEIQRQLENYRRLRELIDEWITVPAQLSTLRLREKRRLLSESPARRRKSKLARRP